MSRNIVIIGGGASITPQLPQLWDKIKNEEVWSINFAFLTFSFLPSREIWMDLSFFKNNIESLQKLYIQGGSCHAKKNSKYALIPEINLHETTRNPNEKDKKLYVGRMGLSGFFALSLAIKENPNNIFLLGYDFKSINGKTHYYQDTHKVQSSGVGHPEIYVKDGKPKDEVRDWENFLGSNIPIYNVSLESAIECFPKISYEEMFSKLEKK